MNILFLPVSILGFNVKKQPCKYPIPKEVDLDYRNITVLQNLVNTFKDTYTTLD